MEQEAKPVGTIFVDLQLNWAPFVRQLREIADAIEAVTNAGS